MGKFIDWLFENNLDNTSAKDRIFGEEGGEFKIKFEKEEDTTKDIIREIWLGSDSFELKINKSDIKQYNEKNGVPNLFNRYKETVLKNARTLGYHEAHFDFTDWHDYYDLGSKEDSIDFVSALSEYLRNLTIFKIGEASPCVNVLGVRHEVAQEYDRYNFRKYTIGGIKVANIYKTTPFVVFDSIVGKVKIPSAITEQEYFEKQFFATLKENSHLQEYVINKSLSKFKIKIKEQRDDVAIDMLKIEVVLLKVTVVA